MKYEELFTVDRNGAVEAVDRAFSEDDAHGAYVAIFNKYVTDEARTRTDWMVCAIERARFELHFLAHNTFFPQNVYNECMESLDEVLDEVRHGGCCVVA